MFGLALLTSLVLALLCRCTGSRSGAFSLEPLVRQTDNTWAVKFTPPAEETISIKLDVDGLLAAQTSLLVADRSPTALDLASSLQQATFTSQAATATASVMNSIELLAFADESSFLDVPVRDKTDLL